MTVLEEFKLELREEFMEEGREAGRAEGREETRSMIIQSLITHFPDYTDDQIAKVSNLPVEMVIRVRSTMKGNGKKAKSKEAASKSAKRQKKS